MASNTDPVPKHFGLLIFPGFEALDAFGPMEVLNGLSRIQDLTLSIIAQTTDPVSTQLKGVHSVGQRILPTHTFTTVPDLDVLIVPGGYGALEPAPELLNFLKTTGGKVKYLITVCNGASLVAQVGLLDGKKATTNKAIWKICVASGPKVHWIAKARWIRDGDTWTSSGVSAGIDCLLAWIGEEFGKGVAEELANGMEFVRAVSSRDDPFCEMYGCEDVLPNV